MIYLVALFVHLSAQEVREKTAFEQALEQNQMVQTEERWTEVNGVRYREVVYQGQKFYLRFIGRNQEQAELNCNLRPQQPHLAEGGAQVFKRTKIFVSFLRETCSNLPGGRTKDDIVIDPRLGFTIPDDKNSVIKNKKVYITPTKPGLGFSGDW